MENTWVDHLKISQWQKQLVTEYDHINWAHGLKLTRPVLAVLPVTSYWGQWDPLQREIKISISLIENYPWVIVIEILKHEIAHQLVSDRLGIEDGHGPCFQEFCELLGLETQFRRSKGQISLDTIQLHTTRSWNQSQDPEAQRLIQKAEKLLSLAQSTNEFEALSAMKKVNELYAKYNLDLLEKKPSDRDYRFIQIDLKSQKTNWIYPLICSILQEHYYVDVVLGQTYHAQSNQSSKTIELFGSAENLKMAEYVFYFLVRTTQDLWSQNSRSHSFLSKHKRSFQLGLLHGFNEKLRLNRKQTPSSPPPKGLVLIHDDSLSEYAATRFPRLKKKSHGSGRVFTDAFQSGHKEGQSLIINKGLERKGSASVSSPFLSLSLKK